MGAAVEHLTVILMDTSVEPDAQVAVEVAARGAEQGAMLQRRNNSVEIIPMDRLDEDVRHDNRLWNLVLRAKSIVLVGAFQSNGEASMHLQRFMRLSNGEFNLSVPRIAALTVSRLAQCNCNQSICNGGVQQLHRWARSNHLPWTMDANISIEGMLNRDYDSWREMSKIVGEIVVV